LSLANKLVYLAQDSAPTSKPTKSILIHAHYFTAEEKKEEPAEESEESDDDVMGGLFD
jgi:ribosomal protein L12E/L44/L45/RPP1/RPP2